MVASGLYELLAGTPAVADLLGDVPEAVGGAAIYLSVAPKTPPVPFLIIHKLPSEPAGQTLDGVSNLTDGEFQFDSYGAEATDAQFLSGTVKAFLQNFGGTLGDGTGVQFVEVTADFDNGYELGAYGYLFRCVLRLKAFYTELS
jgi:hypothetical protein